jgi:hypothetical protein
MLELKVALQRALSGSPEWSGREWLVEHASFVSSNKPAILGEQAKGDVDGKCEVQCDIPKRV